jgi:hypothetical protein
MPFDRRKFLALGVQIPAAMIVTKAASAAACVDTDELSDSVMSMRESLEYTDSAPDPKQSCSGCEYFKPPKPGDTCGPCNVLTTPVSAKGHCVSWTQRD